MISKFKNETNPKIYAEAVGFIKEWKKKPYSLTNKQIDTLAYICKQIGHEVRDKKCGMCLKNSCEIVEAYIKNYQDLNANTINNALSNYNQNELYEGKTILLLGFGKISKKMHAQRKKYDIIVGMDDIVNSSNYKYVDVVYYSLNNEIEIPENKIIIFNPTRNSVKLDKIRNMLNNNQNIKFNIEGNPSTNMIIEDIMKGNPETIDIIGFDEIDEDILNKYPNITHYA